MQIRLAPGDCLVIQAADIKFRVRFEGVDSEGRPVVKIMDYSEYSVSFPADGMRITTHLEEEQVERPKLPFLRKDMDGPLA